MRSPLLTKCSSLRNYPISALSTRREPMALIMGQHLRLLPLSWTGRGISALLDLQSYQVASSTVHPQLGMSSPLTHVSAPERLSTHTFVADGRIVQRFSAVSDLTCAVQALLLPRNSLRWLAVAAVEQRT